jgi:hypothetical protein
MNFARFLLFVAAAGVGLHYWHQHQAAVAISTAMASADANGFVELPPARGQNPDTVYVVAAVNCPHEAAQRADRLAKDLDDKGIPVVRTNNVGFTAVGVDQATVDRVRAIMDGPLPIVFVHGRAKSAPSLEDVEAEFRSSPSSDAKEQPQY